MISSNYEKYQTGNPLMQAVIQRFLRHLCARIVELRPRTILDLGCGEGLVAREIGKRLPNVHYVGIDLSEEALCTAREINPTFEFRQGSILERSRDTELSDLAICVEVLEHLERPDLGLDRIAASTREHALISVPWEPYFRLGNFLRGKYLGSWGNHPEHVQQFSPTSLRDLVSTRFSEVRVETCFPWLIAVGQRRDATSPGAPGK
jgi:SAM-dependent methyltransferase